MANYRLNATGTGSGTVEAFVDGVSQGTQTSPGALTWTISVTGVQEIALVNNGPGTVTLSDVETFSITDTGATDSTAASDSNTCQVVSPASVAVSDSTTCTDSNVCTVTQVATVAAPFLLAASFLVAVLYDTVNADTGSASDSVVIAQTLRHTDASTSSDAVTIGLLVPVSDSTTSSDSVGAVVGSFSAVEDSSSSSDEATAELVIRVAVSDATTSSDTVGLEFISPETIEIVDSTTSTDSNSVVHAIGQSDSTISSDVAYAVVGVYTFTADSTTSSEIVSATVSAGVPSNVKPVAAHAEAIRNGIVATEIRPGTTASRVIIGLVYGGTSMQTGKAYQGCDFPIFFPKAKDASGANLDLSGATLLCYALIGGSPVAASSTSVDATKGTAEAMFSSAQTNTWTAGTTIAFDGLVRLANGTLYPIGSGKFLVADPITPTP